MFLDLIIPPTDRFLSEFTFGDDILSKNLRELADGERFAFGDNWAHFLKNLNEKQIKEAKKSLKELLEINDLEGKSFLDIGSGSGLFSMAARRLGASVHSFDYDLQAVYCTEELKSRYFPKDSSWLVEEGNILDKEYLKKLGQFDIVYSWGVLHHTGQMWQAFENIVPLVKPGGQLFIAIYNDQGGASKRWKMIKRVYNHSPKFIKIALVISVGMFLEGRSAIIRLARLQNPLPFRDWARKQEDRGMSVWHDLIDWVGGYPFEVAKPEQVFNFFKINGFSMENLTTCGGGYGCNQFVFRRSRINSSKDPYNII